jgi:hypothetical protein
MKIVAMCPIEFAYATLSMLSRNVHPSIHPRLSNLSTIVLAWGWDFRLLHGYAHGIVYRNEVLLYCSNDRVMINKSWFIIYSTKLSSTVAHSAHCNLYSLFILNYTTILLVVLQWLALCCVHNYYNIIIDVPNLIPSKYSWLSDNKVKSGTTPLKGSFYLPYWCYSLLGDLSDF